MFCHLGSFGGRQRAQSDLRIFLFVLGLFWNKNDNENMSRCNQISNRRTFWKKKFKKKNVKDFFQTVFWFEIWIHLDIFSSSFLFQKYNLGCKNVYFEKHDILFYLFFDLNHQRTSQDFYLIFLSLGEQEIKIAVWGRVLLCSWLQNKKCLFYYSKII